MSDMKFKYTIQPCQTEAVDSALYERLALSREEYTFSDTIKARIYDDLLIDFAEIDM